MSNGVLKEDVGVLFKRQTMYTLGQFPRAGAKSKTAKGRKGKGKGAWSLPLLFRSRKVVFTFYGKLDIIFLAVPTR